MASYAMAHLKLDLLLTELGYKPTKHQRLKVFLTNSLEEHHPDTDTLFATWLASEANEANKVKRDTPVMVVMGNPPYSISSSNKGEWINSLIDDYKRDLNERNIQPLSDDYIKFIRYGQHYIEKNGEGILAYISNNSFIDGIIHRQMRKHLLETFDTIYILDLHGNSKKKEITPTGGKDENVFDIMQGVSINIFIKTGKRKQTKLGKVYHYDLYGKRDEKYSYLNMYGLNSIQWSTVEVRSPDFYFVPKDYDLYGKYEHGFSIEDLFSLNSNGTTTERDHLLIQFTKDKVKNYISALKDMPIENFREQYTPKKDGRDWTIKNAKEDIIQNSSVVSQITYRPFDIRYAAYTGKTKGLMAYPRDLIMRHLITDDNVALLSGRQGQAVGPMQWNLSFITKTLVDRNFNYRGGTIVFPLYLYPDEASLTQERTPNLNTDIINKTAKGLNLTFTPEKSDDSNSFAPIDLLDYIYAILHNPGYREKYKEFLKSDFPRVPYPDNTDTFWQLVELGGKLRQVHLLESSNIEEYITSYPLDGDNTITRRIVKKDFEITDEENGLGRVWINNEQYFDNVPIKAWGFYIGGYQPAQKWLKDRKGRTLGFEDILHYQKIVKALMLTDQYMKEIDKVVSWE